MTREGRVNYYASKNSYFSMFSSVFRRNWAKNKNTKICGAATQTLCLNRTFLSLFPKDDLKNKKVENTFSRPTGQSERRIRARQLLERVADSERHYHTHTRSFEQNSEIVNEKLKNTLFSEMAEAQEPKPKKDEQKSKTNHA